MRSSDNYLVNVLDKLEADRAARRHADRPHRRPRRDGARPRRPAAEELQLLRGVDAGAARLLEPEALPAAAEHRRDGLPRRLPADAGQPGGGAESARADWQGVDYSTLVLDPRPAKAVQDYVVFTYDDYQSARRTGPTRNRRTTSSASAKGAGSWPSTTTSEGEPQAAAVGDVRPEGRTRWRRQNIAHPKATNARHAGETAPAAETKLARVEKTRLKEPS